nr:hypothetical protein [Tanacetum cinerariifolium]
EDASKQRRRIEDLDANDGVALVDETKGRNDQDMFDTSIFDDEEVAEKDVSTADPVTTAGEVVTTAVGVSTSKQRRRIEDLDANDGVALVDETKGRNDQDMFDTSIFDDEEVAEKDVSTADPVTTAGEVVTTAVEVSTTAGVEVSTAAITSQISMDEITLAKALIDIKTSKPKAKGIIMKEPSETPTPAPKDTSQ